MKMHNPNLVAIQECFWNIDVRLVS